MGPQTPRNLSVGCQGADVARLQYRLNNRMPPWSTPLAVDRIFGPKTSRAVMDYQKVRGLKPDGIVGPRTRDALSTRLFLIEGTLYREMPAEAPVAHAAGRTSRLLLAQAVSPPVGQSPPTPPTPTPPTPAPSVPTTVVQLQPGITVQLPPWIFPRTAPRPGAILQRTLQFAVVYKSGDHVGHVEAGAFVQVSSNSQNSPSDPKVSFTGGWQFVAADLIAPWKLPLPGWKFHPLSLVFQQTLVFNARPGSVQLGMSIGEQAQLDLGSDRFGVIIGAGIGPTADLTQGTVTGGPNFAVGAVATF